MMAISSPICESAGLQGAKTRREDGDLRRLRRSIAGE
jgi:hypothetical protein